MAGCTTAYSTAVGTRGHHLKMLQLATRIDAYLHIPLSSKAGCGTHYHQT